MSQTNATQSTGFLETLLCVLLLFGITIFLPTYFKTWFVEPTGNIKIAPFFGFIIGIGLLFRKSWARTGALILGWGVLVISLVSILSDATRPGFWIVLVLDGFLLYLLHNDRVKRYIMA